MVSMVDAATRVVMTLAFAPRGGSAYVARSLSAALGNDGLDVTLCCGSIGPPGSKSHAETFFSDLDVRAIDFSEAAAWFSQGRDPMLAPVPMHPSFEDRPGAPDRVFALISPAEYDRQVAVWRTLLAGVGRPDLYHVHHLSHVNDAIRTMGETPVVVHLHGTELAMLSVIADQKPPAWHYASQWQQRLVAAAHRADRLVVVSPSDRDRAVDLLGIGPNSIDVVPNGVDLTLFSVDPLPAAERMDHWHRWLVGDPQGWDESGVVGSLRYTAGDVDRCFRDPLTDDPLPVLLFVGRFTNMKRVPLLIRAYAKARTTIGPSAPPLVIWGGHPGEWEGEHPHSVVASMGVDGVFFAGWRGHDELAQALNCADVLVAPSVDEPFGLVYIEAMAAGLPVIATASGGPPTFVNTDLSRPNGWLVSPDDEHDLALAMVAALSDGTERRRRGERGRVMVERQFGWPQIARRFEAIYAEVLDRPGRSAGMQETCPTEHEWRRAVPAGLERR